MPVFLAPWFLLASLAASVPIALHLLQRRKPQPVPYSTLRFLREALATTRRSRHLTNLLALLMRVLIVLLLALAFSRPKIHFGGLIPQGKRTAILILDGAAGMRLRHGDKMAFDLAREWAEELINAMDEGDRVAVLVPGLPEPRLVFPPNSDRKVAVRLLQDVRPGYGTAGVSEILNDLLGRLDGRTDDGTEIHIFSDFQAAGWDEVEVRRTGARLRERGARLFLNRVQPAATVNAGITRAEFSPPAVLGDGRYRARVSVGASRDFDGGNTLRLVSAGEELVRLAVDPVPDQVVKEVLPGSSGGEGACVTGQIELDADVYEEDNVYRFSLPRIEGIPVLLVDGSARGTEGTRDVFFLNHAIRPRGTATTLFLPEIRDWPGFLAGDIRQFSIIYICNPPAMGETAATKILDFVRNGGTAVLMPGGNFALEAGLSGLTPLAGMTARKDVLPREQSVGLVASETSADLEKRLLAVMPGPGGLVVRQRLLFETLPEDSRTVFHYADGMPFAFTMPHGRGAVWVISVSANRDWSEWPLTPFFVLFHQELIKGSTAQDVIPLMGHVGSPVAIRWPENTTEPDFTVTDPGGRSRTVSAIRPSADSPAVLSGFEEPGFYTVSRNDKTLTVAINIPEAETDMRFLTPEEMSIPLRGVDVYHAGSALELRKNLADVRQGRPLWPALLALAFFLAVTEELFANIRSRAAAIPDALRQLVRRGGADL